MLKKKTEFQEDEEAAVASDRDEDVESPYPDWDDGELDPDFDGGNGGLSIFLKVS